MWIYSQYMLIGKNKKLINKNNKIIIAFESLPDFSDNSSALFDYFSKNASDRYELVWLLSDKENRQTTTNVRCLHSDDEDFEIRFNEIDIIFSTHNTHISYKKKHQTWISLWHGINIKNLGLFVDGSIEERQWINVMSSKIDYFVMTSRYTSTVFSASFDISYDSFLEFGQPRCDKLKSKNSKTKLASVLKLASIKDINKIIFYLPTFKSGIGKNEGYVNKKNLLNCLQYNESILDNYLEKNNYIIVTKQHPLEESVINHKKSSRMFTIKDSELIKLNLTLYDIVGSCDLLVTDYSSISLDIFTINKPTLYIHTDFEDYIKKRGIVFDDYELWFPGPRVSRIDDFINESAKLLNDKSYYDKERTRTNRVLNGKYNFDSCKKILDFIDNRIFKNLAMVDKIIEKNKELKDINNKLFDQSKLLNENNEKILLKLKEIEKSNSWRITKPLRKMVLKLNKIKTYLVK
jgi:CDP-glycerol glycerophosphotransferase (TagB/SpsB family)